jgi:hypothetical protein
VGGESSGNFLKSSAFKYRFVSFISIIRAATLAGSALEFTRSSAGPFRSSLVSLILSSFSTLDCPAMTSLGELEGFGDIMREWRSRPGGGMVKKLLSIKEDKRLYERAEDRTYHWPFDNTGRDAPWVLKLCNNKLLKAEHFPHSGIQRSHKF